MNSSVPRLAIDGKGYVWRVWPDAWSMAPNNPDNSPITEPITYYTPQSERDALREAVARLMRHQAVLADALDLGEDDDLSAELIASRDEAKRALGR